jgi:hypothetical protein
LTDRRARFEQLVLPHMDAAYNLARWLTRNDHDARDVVQEAMLRAFRFCDGLRGEARPWLLAIVRNACFTWLQANRPADLAGALDDRPEEPSPEEGPEALVARELDRRLLNEAIAALWGFVGDANRLVEAEQPWVLAKAASAGDEAAAERLRGVLGDLVEACRLVALAAAPIMPAAAPRILEQLGHGYEYGPDGNGGPALEAELAWGAHAGEAAQLGEAAPLFPRLDVDSPLG